jgi:predicted NUDIX family phosphoesterase
MGKLALGVNKSDVVKIIPDLAYYNDLTLSEVKTPFFSLPSHLRDRSDCETDETFLQFIPYITLISADKKVLTYRRGAAGDENRLHNLYSIGIGGHVEDTVSDDATLLDVLSTCAIREIAEETGLDIVSLLENESISDRLENNAAVIYDPINAVGKVHLGLSIILELNYDSVELFNLMQAELGVIEAISWTELYQGLDIDMTFEPWSLAVVRKLLY